MIGLVIVTHGNLAHEFHAALEHIVGPQSQIEAIAIAPEDDAEARRAEILTAVAAVDSGEGVAIATDMFGGTPSNLAISTMGDAGVEVIAGVNLPLLVKFVSNRQENTLVATVNAAKEAGRKYIIVASQLLDEKNGGRDGIEGN